MASGFQAFIGTPLDAFGFNPFRNEKPYNTTVSGSSFLNHETGRFKDKAGEFTSKHGGDASGATSLTEHINSRMNTMLTNLGATIDPTTPFDPALDNVVDLDNDTMRMTGHGLQTRPCPARRRRCLRPPSAR